MKHISSSSKTFIERVRQRKEEYEKSQKEEERKREEFLANHPKPEDHETCPHGNKKYTYELSYEFNNFEWIKKNILACRECNFIQNIHKKLNIPKRYWSLKPDSTYLKFLANDRGILFTGGVGTGKTYSLITLLLALAEEKNELAPFQTFSQITSDIRESIATNSYAEVYDRYANSKILVIDDLGVENATEFMKSFVNNIINERYNNMLPVIITTNLNSKELSEIYSQRISSRLYEMCEIVSLKGTDRRKGK